MKTTTNTQKEKNSNDLMHVPTHQLITNFITMKTRNFLFAILAIAGLVLFASCEETNLDPKQDETTILPERFKVDIPDAISNDQFKSSKLKSTQDDTLNGNEIYQNLAYFIAIGEGAADIVEAIIFHIRLYNIQSVLELTYTSDDDNRVKRLVVEQGAEYNERNWEYMLTITDVDSETEEDGGIGMQVFWNNNPIEGIALIKPYNLDRINDADAGDAMFSVEYSEKGMDNYEAYMMIEIADLPLSDASIDPYSVDNIKMFVGKNGDVVDVYGNSNHPNAQFFTDDTGFNWAFVASGNEEKNIAVAEVGLPSSTLDSDNREVILKDYSIKNVFTNEINQWFLDTFGIRPDSTDLANYLKNADAPGYFDHSGFIQGGTAPNNEYGVLEQHIDNLTPYNPSLVDNLEIVFKR